MDVQLILQNHPELAQLQISRVERHEGKVAKFHYVTNKKKFGIEVIKGIALVCLSIVALFIPLMVRASRMKIFDRFCRTCTHSLSIDPSEAQKACEKVETAIKNLTNLKNQFRSKLKARKVQQARIESAVKIQSALRGFLARKVVGAMKIEKKSAVRIQKFYQAFHKRRNNKAKLQKRSKILNRLPLLAEVHKILNSPTELNFEQESQLIWALAILDLNKDKIQELPDFMTHAQQLFRDCSLKDFGTVYKKQVNRIKNAAQLSIPFEALKPLEILAGKVKGSSNEVIVEALEAEYQPELDTVCKRIDAMTSINESTEIIRNHLSSVFAVGSYSPIVVSSVNKMLNAILHLNPEGFDLKHVKVLLKVAMSMVVDQWCSQGKPVDITPEPGTPYRDSDKLVTCFYGGGQAYIEAFLSKEHSGYDSKGKSLQVFPVASTGECSLSAIESAIRTSFAPEADVFCDTRALLAFKIPERYLDRVSIDVKAGLNAINCEHVKSAQVRVFADLKSSLEPLTPTFFVFKEKHPEASEALDALKIAYDQLVKDKPSEPSSDERAREQDSKECIAWMKSKFQPSAGAGSR
ncbi:MAG: hypothetical protein MRY21_02205 [Simkaniaceae bacterium]|nr:hypothetical protein [Simkaniaceae bacterium]